MADPQHLALLRQGVQEWNTWRQKHPEVHPDLSRANLSRAALSQVNLCGANLKQTYLRATDLRAADLREASLCLPMLNEANLCEASPLRANLRGAKLSGADLSEATLGGRPSERLICARSRVWKRCGIRVHRGWKSAPSSTRKAISPCPSCVALA